MPESQHLSVIRIWAALAWADGVIADAEAEAMKKLISMADLSDRDRRVALGWLQQKVELDTSNVTSLGEESRQSIYRAAVKLAVVDLELADEERGFLRRLRQGLSIDDAVAEDIEAGILQQG